MRIGLLLLFIAMGSLTYAQPMDTLRVMTYNLLFYGEVTSFCTTSNNPIAEKDDHFKVIADYLQPDLILVNEMGASAVYAERILAKVLNVDGETRFRRADIQNNSFSNLVNCVFYDKTKLSLVNQEKVTKTLNNADIVRVIDVVTFYYKEPELDAESDTTFLHLVGMHLKAGGSQSDEDARDVATEALMEFLVDNYQPGNFILAGDLNIGSSSEEAFKNLKSAAYPNHRFVDPLVSGSWAGTSSYAATHTQSTKTSGDGCASGGGLDDRFDLIMLSQSIMNDSGSVDFIEDSYTAVGNDGNHYNQSIIDGTNNSVPSDVLDALYGMSDHLPVTVDLRVELIQPDTDTANGLVRMPTSADLHISQFGDAVRFQSNGTTTEISVFDLSGRLHISSTMNGRERWMDLSSLSEGFYIVRLRNSSGQTTRKIFLSR